MSAEEMLSRTVTQLPPPAAGVYSGDADRVEETAEQLEEIAQSLRSMAPDLGIKGASGDTGTEAFLIVMRELFERADEATAAARVARKAYRAVTDARARYQELPPGQIDANQRQHFIRGAQSIPVNGQALTGTQAVNFLDQQAARHREYQAQQILNDLNADMAEATNRLPEIRGRHDTGGFAPHPDSTPSGGSTRPYTSGGGGSTGVGGVPVFQYSLESLPVMIGRVLAGQPPSLRSVKPRCSFIAAS